MKQSEIRKDYIQEKYVIIAPSRGKRPEQKNKTQKKICVFCPRQVEKNNTVVYKIQSANEKIWDVAVIKNKFPAVSLTNPKAYGTQEVVIETPNHNIPFDKLSEDHIVKILNVYAARTLEISKNKKIEYILIFKNDGGHAGASIAHAHSQIFATSFLPPHLLDKSQRVQAYKLKYGSDVYTDVIRKESNSHRLIFKDSHITAFCPYASVYNYEAWILPNRRVDNITLLNEQEKQSFAKILKKILFKINKLGLSYNYYFHQTIHDEDQHLYMKIVPRGSIWAGVEIGSGIIINHVPPEMAAQYYRN